MELTMSRNFLLLVVVLIYSQQTWAHVFKTGACPEVEVVENFSFDKFRGKWYVIEKSQTSSSCMHYNFTISEDGSKAVAEKYRLFGVKIFNWNDFSQTGTLSVPEEVPAKMSVRFPFSINPFSPSSFWVVATDYENYAAIWSCRRFLFGHFQSAMILGRNSTLDRLIVNKMRGRFEFYGVDRADLSVVDQSDCDQSKWQNPVDEIHDLLSNATDLLPSVTAIFTNNTDVNVFSLDGGTSGSDVAVSTQAPRDKEPEPLDSDNMP
ncbi:hypothetical protein CHUAL_013018 [Chamberlinius hualienensis]